MGTKTDRINATLTIWARVAITALQMCLDAGGLDPDGREAVEAACGVLDRPAEGY